MSYRYDSGDGELGTSIPTVDTLAKFDLAKHMNSEDMTPQELSNYIASLPQGISTQVHLQSMLDIFMGNCTNLWPTMSLHNCTGTLTNNVYIRNKGDIFHFGGRIAITGFARTGSNPGVQFTLNGKRPPREFVYYCGIRAESPREVCFFNWYTDGYIRIRTSESYTNASGNTLTLILPSVFICVE